MIWMNSVGEELRKAVFHELFLIVHSELNGKWISAELYPHAFMSWYVFNILINRSGSDLIKLGLQIC